MIKFWRSHRRSEAHTCPVCNCSNFTEEPFEGRTDQGVIGYTRTFECGFATHWRGYRTQLCRAPQADRVVKAIAAVAPAARRVANGSVHLASQCESPQH